MSVVVALKKKITIRKFSLFKTLFYLFYLYICPPGWQENDAGADT